MLKSFFLENRLLFAKNQFFLIIEYLDAMMTH